MLNLPWKGIINYGVYFSVAHHEKSVSSSLANMEAVVQGTGRALGPNLKENVSIISSKSVYVCVWWKWVFFLFVAD
jgi:hypothetical protein